MTEREKDCNFDWGTLYTPPEIAGEEARRRFADEDLRKEVELFLGNDLPAPFLESPKAAFGRDIITPNREFYYFFEQAQKTGLDIFLSEFPEGVFVTQNPDKYYLCKLFFYNKKGKNGGDRLSASKIVDFDASNGKKLKDIKTLWGEQLIDVHKRLFQQSAPDFLSDKCYDISSWFLKKGGSARDYYPYYLGLFIAHGVLFETYLVEQESERIFFESIVLPTIEDLKKRFGIAPLMSPICKQENLEEFTERWMHYPEFSKKTVIKFH